jgi:hypothetical protein
MKRKLLCVELLRKPHDRNRTIVLDVLDDWKSSDAPNYELRNSVPPVRGTRYTKFPAEKDFFRSSLPTITLCDGNSGPGSLPPFTKPGCQRRLSSARLECAGAVGSGGSDCRSEALLARVFLRRHMSRPKAPRLLVHGTALAALIPARRAALIGSPWKSGMPEYGPPRNHYRYVSLSCRVAGQVDIGDETTPGGNIE